MKILMFTFLISGQTHALPREFRSTILNCPEGETTCDFYDKQWNMANHLSTNPWGIPIRTPGDINIETVWQQGIHGSDKIIVAVIDSGVDIHHPDLKGNIFTNEAELPDNGIDDDGNGFIDDRHGWNFVDKSPNVADPIGHGTHIAGIIGARGDNDFGIRGINWKVKILPLVYLDAKSTGNLQNSIAAVHYAVSMGAKIINASWGGVLPDALREAILWAQNQGVLFICSSGNDGENLDIYPYYPASFGLDNMIVVGSSNFDDIITGDSNWGRQTVDILAPGIGILSTLPDNRYGYMSGTSMSTPHVSGAAALLWSEHPTWSYKEVKSALLMSSKVKPVYLNRVRHGRLDMRSSIDGLVHSKPVPQEGEWIRQQQSETLVYDKAGIYTKNLRVPEAKMIRVLMRDLALTPGKQRIVIEDSNGLSLQKFEVPIGNLTSAYVFGNTLTIKSIIDKDGEALQATIDAVEYIP